VDSRIAKGEKPMKLIEPNADDGMSLYRRGSMVIRQKLGIVGNKFTEAQKKAYSQEQRELWLSIFDPQKLEQERILKGAETYNESQSLI
jgi:hypothetical protein